MKTKTVSKTRSAVKRAPAASSAKKTKKWDISWLVDRELPPADQLPENPVLVMRRGGYGVVR